MSVPEYSVELEAARTSAQMYKDEADRLRAEVKRLEREKASLALDRDSWKHKSETDNAYLLAEVEGLKEALRRVRDNAEEFGGDWAYREARDAL